MKPNPFICSVAGLLLTVNPCWADSPLPPIPKVITSWEGRSFFMMIPAQWAKKGDELEIKRESFGVAYAVDENGQIKELWKISGWYTRETYLSNDGQYLVRMGPWNYGREPTTNDLAVAFYKNGKLLKEYSTAELVKDKSKVFQTVTHYDWRDRTISRSKADQNVYLPRLGLDSGNIFHLKTIDGIVYRFDATNGEIKEQIDAANVLPPDCCKIRLTFDWLKKLSIQQIEFQNVDLQDFFGGVVNYFRDGFDHPPVNIVLIPPEGNQPKLTLTIKNKTLQETLDLICMQTGHVYDIDEVTGVIIVRTKRK